MKLNTLKPGKGFEKRIHWCGPAALALITGRTLKHCHRLLAQIRGIDQRYLKGVQNWEMLRALKEMGFDVTEVSYPGKAVTLRQYIDEVQRTKHFRETCLLEITGHYVVAHRGLVADNHWHDPVPPIVHQWHRRLVRRVWVVKTV